jgi:hypothetical protein
MPDTPKTKATIELIFWGDRQSMSQVCRSLPKHLGRGEHPFLNAVHNGFWSDSDRDMAEWIVTVQVQTVHELNLAMGTFGSAAATRLDEVRVRIEGNACKATCAMIRPRAIMSDVKIDKEAVFGGATGVLERCHAELGAVLAGRYDAMEAGG